MEAPVVQPTLPVLTDLMNEWFYGHGEPKRREIDTAKGGGVDGKSSPEKESGYGAQPPSTSRLTQEWLEEAKKMVAAAPISRGTSPARSAGSPRFAAASPAAKQLSSPTQPLDRSDALSRSARSRAIEGVSEEILHRSSARHNRNLSEVHLAAAASAVGQNASNPFDENDAGASPTNRLPPKLPPNPRTRFQEKAPDDVPPRRSLGIPPPSSRTPDIPPRRSFRSPSPSSQTHLPRENAADPPLRRILRSAAPLSVPSSPIPPEKSSEVTPRRRFSGLLPSSRPPSPIPREIAPDLSPPLSPPRILNESAPRRSYSADKPSTPLISVSLCPKPAAEIEQEDVMQINSFLTRQRAMITRVSEGQVSSKAKIVLSSYSPNTSSMVAAICYAWLLENTREKEKKWVKEEVVVPVINMRREMMWEHRQAAWIFHHIGIDASALMFSDELDFEGLLMGKQLSLHVVGQDVLQTNGEVGSLCTVLTDNYCEDAYSLLQAPNLKKLLLAGILLETRNLNNVAKRNRDVEAVQLLLVGSSPNYRDFFFEQVMKEHEEDYFLEALRQHYGKPSSEVQQMPSKAPAAGRAVAAQPVPDQPPALFKATERSCRPKNKFSFIPLEFLS
ncbi:hypothetical protein KSP40_PGU021231 [Platanthera guangdongensis]|uniref:Uncharacterized protein n=1 Tax=Platanthera guangdongensis TaxID=2320717 RepID=A0ABR2MDU4_9ASPA